jgi:CRISPR-associated endoribonuclease Cas6
VIELNRAVLELSLSEPIRASDVAGLGPYLQGVLMQAIDTDYAALLHQQEVNPYSQFVRPILAESDDQGKTATGLRWRINTLNQEAAAEILEPVTGSMHHEFRLNRPGLDVKVTGVEKLPALSEAELNKKFYAAAANRIRIQFRTPTAFRQRGKYVFFPEPRLVFQSLAIKHAALSRAEEPEFGLLEEFDRSIDLTWYGLNSRRFRLGAATIPGCVGSAAYFIHGAPTLRSYLGMLLAFGEYSGCGIKTAMGMGAMAAREN